MKKYSVSTIKVFLSLLILFSFFTIVKAQGTDYEFLIITPAKYEAIAQQFIALHDGTGAGGIIDETEWKIRGAYVLVENIIGRYDGEPGGEIEPFLPGAPPVLATPGEDQIGEDYKNDVSLNIIKFLRGILQFPQEHSETDNRPDYDFAFSILRDVNGVMGKIRPIESSFTYLLILGETGAAGPATVTFNGVPESWYVWMDEGVYNQDPDADGTWFPTDFFYAAPNYYNDELNWIPSLRVGRLPIHDRDNDLNDGLPGENTVTEITTIREGSINNYGIPSGGLIECDVCDSTPTPRWTASAWAVTRNSVTGVITDAYELVITSDGNPDDGDKQAVGATYLILDNTDTCLRVLGDPETDGVEAEDLAADLPGDRYEIRRTIDEAQNIYDKCEDYTAAVITGGAWNDWFRKVVTVGGDSSPALFSFWDEFVHAKIINEGYFEGNEIVKLRHTNKDNVPTDDDFTVTSLAPYLQDKDCGLLFHLGYGYGSGLILDDEDGDPLTFENYITNNNVLGYTSSDSHIPIMISNSHWNGRFDMLDGCPCAIFRTATPSFGAAVVESPTGGGIAYIGSTDSTYQGIIPYFDNGVLDQARLYNFDELLSYTIESFYSSPKFIGDMFLGSPASIEPGQGPIHKFLANNFDVVGEGTGLSFWASQKTIFEYTLLGDPVLPIPHPNIGSDPIETRTVRPNLAFDETTLRAAAKGRYESHKIAVDEIPTSGSASTTVNISPVNSPSAVPQVKITRVDIRRDTGVDYPAPEAPANYLFTTLNTVPGYYFVRVEQPGWDPNTGSWSTGPNLWWEKERWIYVQLVNEFQKSPGADILVVDDDFGYPIVTWYYVPKEFNYFLSSYTRGYEDWYLRALDNVPAAGDYDVWHVDFDDSYTVYLGGDRDDDWGIGGGAADSGDALMHGEVYEGLLDNYAKVIWLTGDSSGYWRPYPQLFPGPRSTWLIETITNPEETCLKNYLNNSGRLFLSGQGILEDLGCSGIREADAFVAGGNNVWCERRSGEGLLGIQNDFLANYLHITDLHSSSEFGYISILNRVADNPVIEGNLTIGIRGPYGAENQFYFVDAEPNLDTPIVSRIFQYDLTSGGKPPHIGDPAYPFIGTAGTAYYRGRGANVFLPWGFEAINKQKHRNQVMTAILSWLDNPTRTGEGEDEGGDGDDGSGGADGGGVGSLSGCFIATASYGTPMAEEVKALSQFRDEYLMTNSLGKFFVRSYYKFSPQLAEYISQRPMLKRFVRIGLKPLVRFSEKLVEE